MTLCKYSNFFFCNLPEICNYVLIFLYTKNSFNGKFYNLDKNKLGHFKICSGNYSKNSEICYQGFIINPIFFSVYSNYEQFKNKMSWKNFGRRIILEAKSLSGEFSGGQLSCIEYTYYRYLSILDSVAIPPLRKFVRKII